MSRGINWFKSYKIRDRLDGKYWHAIYEIKYIDGGSTSHSAGNIIKVDHLFEKYGNKVIPTINEEWIDSVEYDLELIEPKEMVEICNKILANTDCDEVDMRDRIEWFKRLSEDGYYFTYDWI